MVSHLGGHRRSVSAALMLAVAVLLTLPVAAQDGNPSRGLWVWETSPLLSDPAQRAAFFNFCERHNIDVAGVYIRTEPTPGGRRLNNAPEWAAVLAESTGRGMRLHALDGDPSYALHAHHDTMLAVVDAVISYNASVEPSARFSGIHFDVEPYLLPEWKTPETRERLLGEYLDVNDRAAKRSRAAGLVYGVDIPFWWQVKDEATGEPVSVSTFQGVRKSATEHLLAMVDNVGIMAYRNVPTGPQGIVSLALETLDSADRISQARVFVGLETEKISEGVPENTTFANKSLKELQEALAIVDRVFIGRPSFAGVAVHSYVTLKELEERLQAK